MVLLWFNLSIVSILFYQHIKLQFKDKITFRMYFYFLKFSQKIPKLSVWSPQWFVKNNPRFYFEKKNSLDFYFEIERCTFNWKIYYFFLQNSIPKKTVYLSSSYQPTRVCGAHGICHMTRVQLILCFLGIPNPMLMPFYNNFTPFSQTSLIIVKVHQRYKYTRVYVWSYCQQNWNTGGYRIPGVEISIPGNQIRKFTRFCPRRMNKRFWVVCTLSRRRSIQGV